MKDGSRFVQDVIKALTKVGWRISFNSRHYKAYPPDPEKPMVVFSATPSDHRAIMNIRSEFRKQGVIIEKII